MSKKLNACTSWKVTWAIFLLLELILLDLKIGGRKLEDGWMGWKIDHFN